ncbi:BsuBI/PstI family type II restriction endonuclease [Saccharibacillus kuerlensis]|uniref:Restriction endonuclease n=1 Tax=Saccharibacillus kuerlensis TaxID=459527 RepID=A0ABQ2KWG7_9BACL|nr:BsuBI/PstI family type II restriction endonuclease [Saccharibacillus kuerlensis]GGN94971.1 hypothetical protein GCM10010969_10200 [Saccharibacillus kuerlensis]
MKTNVQEILTILEGMAFPKQYTNELTAICILALQDRTPRSGLIKGHTCLAEGARITDILNYARNDLGKNYAENTRETVRKNSLKQLVEFGLVHVNKDDPKRSVNSGKTNYTLVEEFSELLQLQGNPELLAQKMLNFADEITLNRQSYLAELQQHDIMINVPFSDTIIPYSPGDHNVIAKLIVEEIFKEDDREIHLAYLGDTKDKSKFLNGDLLNRLEISIDQHAKLPDVIGVDLNKGEVFIFEAVASSGPVDTLRKKELELLFAQCPYQLRMATVFLKRNVFQKYSNNIAPDTTVYVIENRMKISYKEY